MTQDAKFVAAPARDIALVIVDDEHFISTLDEAARKAVSAAAALREMAEVLGEYLNVSRCFFAQIDLGREISSIEGDFHRDTFSLAGSKSMAGFPARVRAEALAGRTIVTQDTKVDPLCAADYERVYAPIGLRARIAVPLLSDGLLYSTLIVASAQPRAWQDREISLVRLVAERASPWMRQQRSNTSKADTEASLRLSEQRFRALVDASAQIVWTMTGDGKVAEDSPSWRAYTGQTEQQWLSGEALDAVHPDDLERTRAVWANALQYTHAIDTEHRIRHVSGEWRWHSVRAVPLLDSHGKVREWVGMNIDITGKRAEEEAKRHAERVRALAESEERLRSLVDQLQTREAALAASLKEREVLLQEVHHRVKNNLQMIASLVSMQIRHVDDASSRTALQECKARVETLALIHQQLYQSRNYAHVAFAEYAGGLARNIFQALGRSSASVVLDLTIDDIALRVDRAIPCALAMNELITNALKHAFPGTACGRLGVEIRRTDTGSVSLSVMDNGVGLPRGFDPTKVRSLGMHLLLTLAEQLGGRFEFVSAAGAAFTLTFPVEV